MTIHAKQPAVSQKCYGCAGERTITVLLGFIICGTLVNAHFFISASYSAYILYTILSALFVCVTTYLLRKHDTAKAMYGSGPVIYSLLLGGYFLLHGFLINHAISARHIYFISGCLLFTALYLYFRVYSTVLTGVWWVIMVAAVAEALICLCQYAGFLKSQNSYFMVTGTWTNPNVTAMFICLALPALWAVFAAKRIKRMAAAVILLLYVSVLLLLACRTAVIGAFTILTIVTYSNTAFVQALKQRLRGIKAILVIAPGMILLTAAGIYLYKVKQASADGRKTVWKITMQMIADKPFTGFGYGRFERAYNLYQAAYFAGGTASSLETAHAAHVKMAYNEFLENTAEGGITGLFIFSGILLVLLRKFPRNDKNGGNDNIIAAYAGIACFAVMSIFNFTIQAIPVFCLFIIYAALLMANAYRNSRSTWFPAGLFAIPTALLVCGALAVFLLQCRETFDQLQNRKAAELVRQGNIINARLLLQPLDRRLSHSESYLKNYSHVLMACHEYERALEQLAKAMKISSSPTLYMQSGNCHEYLHRYNEAENEYNIAAHIEPRNPLPHYALMQMYLKAGDTVKAAAAARHLIHIQPKNSTVATEQYKNRAMDIIRLYGH